MLERVVASDAARSLVILLQKKHGAILFYQSGGCCDGSSPMCYPEGELQLGDQDIRLGDIEGAPFYMHSSQYAYWQHTQLIIDVVVGNGGMFSLEGVEGQRFLTRSRVFNTDELQQLQEES